MLGLFTPLATAAIIGVMLTAIAKVHWTHGLDQYLNITYPMSLTFLIGLAVAVAAVLVVLASGRRAAQTQPRSA